MHVCVCVCCCRHLKGEDITSLNHLELMALEEALENGLTSIRDKQASFFHYSYFKQSVYIKLIIYVYSYMLLYT